LHHRPAAGGVLECQHLGGAVRIILRRGECA
jgi:hypothetical protein